MNKWKLWLGLTVILCSTGCMRRYAMTLTDGRTVITRSKPKLEDGYYTWKGHEGETNAVSVGKVRLIEALSPWEQPHGASEPFK